MEAPNILVVRLSAIGDVVMASGLIPALRARFPTARLSWLTEPPTAPLLRHNPRLDEVLVWPRAQWQALWRERRYLALAREVRAFRRQLRERRFDLVLDAQGLLKSGVCAWWTGAPRRMSLGGREGSHWLMHKTVVPPPSTRPVIGSEYRFLAAVLGAPAGSFTLDLAVGEAPRETARRVRDEAGILGPYAVICPFTTRPQKHWFESHWSELADALALRSLTPVMIGGPGDVEAAARIARLDPAIVNLVGHLKLDESVAMIESCRVLVGVDTGLTHMGIALRRPTVALFGSTRPYVETGTPDTAVLYEPMDCAPCRRHPTCGGAFHCMRALTASRVAAQVDMLLSTAR